MTSYTNKYKSDIMTNHIVDEAKRCLKCKNAMCQKGCPLNTPIPTINKYFLSGDLDLAGEMLFENNPLSMVCSLVCNHAAQCKGNCILNKKDSSIDFSSIENYISNLYFDKMKVGIQPCNGKKVAIIGSGPAGITIAFILAKLGYKITIFEQKDKIGGVLQFGIPNFRLPKSILERYHKKLIEIGVQIRLNITIGETLHIKELFNDGYVSVFAGTGVWKAKKLGIPGESLGHVHYAINYLANPDAFNLGQNVVIIGMGNAAIDVARTAIRNGSKNVTLYARHGKAAASQEEVAYAKLDGVKFQFYKKPLAIIDDGIMISNLSEDEEGNLIEDGKSYFVNASSVIISISQGPMDKLVLTTSGLESNETGLLKTTLSGSTTYPGIFAAGDVVHGAKTVVEAVKEAKIVAMAMHKYMLDK